MVFFSFPSLETPKNVHWTQISDQGRFSFMKLIKNAQALFSFVYWFISINNFSLLCLQHNYSNYYLLWRLTDSPSFHRAMHRSVYQITHLNYSPSTFLIILSSFHISSTCIYWTYKYLALIETFFFCIIFYLLFNAEARCRTLRDEISFYN